jgi:DNA-binding NarL/FixJ family response regulator
MVGRVRVVFVDDHELFREGLRALLAGDSGFEVVGEASDARSAYTLIDATAPDLALVDYKLAGTDGISATRELIRRHPNLRVVILSGHEEIDLVADALDAGARGYLLKRGRVEDCVEGLRAVMRGEVFVAPAIPRDMLDELRRKVGGRPRNGIGALSTREREIFGLLVGGNSNSAIARELCISVKTVETHREHILRKLGCHSIVELVRFAARQELLR